MSIDLALRKYCGLSETDYRQWVDRHAPKPLGKGEQEPKRWLRPPPWSRVEEINRADHAALAKALLEQGVSWSPPPAPVERQPVDRWMEFGGWGGAHEFSDYFVATFPAPPGIFRPSVATPQEVAPSELMQAFLDLVAYEGLLCALIVPIDFPQAIRLGLEEHFDFAACYEDQKGNFNGSDDLAYSLHRSLRPLFDVPILSAAAVEEWIEQTVVRCRCEGEMQRTSEIEEQGERWQEFATEASPLGPSLQSQAEQVVAIQKSRPDVEVCLWRLVGLRKMIGRAWRSGFAVGFE